MRLDRTKNKNGLGKYALIKLRVEKRFYIVRRNNRRFFLVPVEAVDFGVYPETEFFVIRLKDENSIQALDAYANAVRWKDFEFAADIYGLCSKASKIKDRKFPD